MSSGNLAPSNFTMALPPEATSVARARKFVSQGPAESLDGVRTDLLAFLVSELATNAVLHARTDFVVSMEWHDDKVRVSVADQSFDPPIQRAYDPMQPTGRGLVLVEAMASRWGFDPTDSGKTVWFELDIDESD